MKKILALLMIGAFLFSMLPFATVAVTGGPEFAVRIDGQYSSITNPVVYKGLKKCTTIEVEVLAWMVTDLYAYEFKLTWSRPDLIKLTDHEVKHIHTADYVLKEKVYNPSMPWDGVTLGYYQQAVTAIAPAEGATGTFTLANLFFHIEVNPQWPDSLYISLDFTVHKMSDSSTGDLEPGFQSGFIQLKPVQPTLKMLPPITVKSVLGETFTVQFEIQNVVKMKSFHFTITWDDHQITTDSQNVFVKDFLHPPYEFAMFTFLDADADLVYDGLEIMVELPCEKTGIDGTGELMGITFTVLDPWGCIPALTGTCTDTPTTLWPGTVPTPWEDYYDMFERCSIPPYYNISQPKTDPAHVIWYTDKCITYINITGYIDKDDGTVFQYLYDPLGVRVKPWFADYYDKICLPWTYNFTAPDPIGYYEFRPIPGDLNLDGHVDVEDLAAIAKFYAKTYTSPRDGWPYYCNMPGTVDNSEWMAIECVGVYKTWHYFADFDLDGNGVIDIFDVVIVAKNICRTEPDPTYPQPIPDP